MCAHGGSYCRDGRRITRLAGLSQRCSDCWAHSAQSLQLFDALSSAEKTLHANPGKHADRLPSIETDSSLRFFSRHLSKPVARLDGDQVDVDVRCLGQSSQVLRV